VVTRALLVVAAVTLDVAVTLAQALAYNVPLLRGPLDALVVAVALLAPTFACILLRNARAHRTPH
jgi:hypothetical protein